jgi:hypothetical protein
MGLRVYVAGSSSDIERAERWIKSLRQRGIVVTASWPEMVRQNGAEPRSVDAATRARWAMDDLAAIAHADVFWMLVPPADEPTIGAWIGFGFAQRSATTIFSGDTRQTSFTALGEEYETDDAAFDRICKIDMGITKPLPK